MDISTEEQCGPPMTHGSQPHTTPGRPRIRTLAFAGLRRLNPFVCSAKGAELLAAWHDNCQIYEFGDINVFAGRNGAGKSTVLDLVAMFGVPGKFGTLPRENRKSDSHCLIDLRFENGAALHATVLPHPLDGFAMPPRQAGDFLHDYQHVQLFVLANGTLSQHCKNVSKVALDESSVAWLAGALAPLQCRVSVWDRDATPSHDALAAMLNRLAAHLSGLESDPHAPLEERPPHSEWMDSRHVFIVFERNKLAAYLSDDRTQANNVSPEALPSGWRSAASLLTCLDAVPDGSICVLEEPDSHMHPALQRAVIAEMAHIIWSKGLQVFLSTHAMSFQSRFLWNASAPSLDVKFFEAAAHELHTGIDERRMLDMLGISGGECGASNGIIWVEGPSDRIYVKHWLALHCAHIGTPLPLEHRDYSFAFHGGAVLAHLGAHGSSQRLDVSRLNRNFVVLMDQDNDIGDGIASEKVNAAKQAMLDDIRRLNSPSCVGLLTPGYTIESSLPEDFRSQYFKPEGDRLLHIRGKKVAIARRYESRFVDWRTCFDPALTMQPVIERILSAIQHWNGLSNSRPGAVLARQSCRNCLCGRHSHHHGPPATHEV
jgi:energy-coupling factor transporter ATP-binding protein EcfA2